MITTDFQIAGRNLARHTLRNLFLGGALAAVTGALVLLGSLTSGMEASMMESALTLLTGHVNVGGFFKVTSGTAAPLVSDYPRLVALVKERVPEVDYLTVRGRGWAKAVSETSSMDLVLAGVEIGNEPAFRRTVRILEGRLDDLAQPGTILLFEGQAERLKVKVGDVVTISAPTTRGVNNTADLRVVVVAKNVGLLSAFSAFVEASSLRALYGLNAEATGAIHVYLKEPAAGPAVAARLREAIRDAGLRVMEPEAQPYWMKMMVKVPSEDWTGQKIDVTTADDEMGQFKAFLQALTWVSWVLAFVLMVVVVIGILNTLAIAIRERTREIGTLRAIGMQRWKVLWLFVLEAGLLGLIGTIVGAIAASLFAAFLNALSISLPEAVQIFLSQEKLHFLLEPRTIALKVVVLSLVTVLASLYPAYRAAKLKPITAMHQIG